MLSDLLVLQVTDVLVLLCAAVVLGAGLVVLAFVLTVTGIGWLVGKATSDALRGVPPSLAQADEKLATLLAGTTAAGTVTLLPPPVKPETGTSKPVNEGLIPSGGVIPLRKIAGSTCEPCLKARQAIKNFFTKKRKA